MANFTTRCFWIMLIVDVVAGILGIAAYFVQKTVTTSGCTKPGHIAVGLAIVALLLVGAFPLLYVLLVFCKGCTSDSASDRRQQESFINWMQWGLGIITCVVWLAGISAMVIGIMSDCKSGKPGLLVGGIFCIAKAFCCIAYNCFFPISNSSHESGQELEMAGR